MAVPRRRRNAIIQEQQEPDSNAPPHLRHLDAALGNGDADALRHALDNLAGSIDEPIENGDTALHLACVYGHLTCVQILLERGASLEAKDEDGEIPLHGACAAGYANIVQQLLDKGNDMNIVKRMLESVDEEGDTVSRLLLNTTMHMFFMESLLKQRLLFFLLLKELLFPSSDFTHLRNQKGLYYSFILQAIPSVAFLVISTSSFTASSSCGKGRTCKCHTVAAS